MFRIFGKDILNFEIFEKEFLKLGDDFELNLYYDYEFENEKITEEFRINAWKNINGVFIDKNFYESKKDVIDYLFNYKFDNQEMLRDVINKMYRM